MCVVLKLRGDSEPIPKYVTRDPKLAEIHNDMSEQSVISKVALRMSELKHAEKQL